MHTNGVSYRCNIKFSTKNAVTQFLYKRIAKPVLFRFDPEFVHRHFTAAAERVGNSYTTTSFLRRLFGGHDARLAQTIAGMNFPSPIGLSAGFDYEARLTQILPACGFGFHSIGTITNLPYDGNPRPMLGRLPHSRSLMVNKGFKNFGAPAIIKKLEAITFEIPLGVSIGRTNTDMIATQEAAVNDIVAAFRAFEMSCVSHSYYEINISCPNLKGNISFYPPEHLEALLAALDALHLSRPLFVKMPIEKTDAETLAMLAVIARHCPVGVIIGNLQKNRQDPALLPKEVSRFPAGNFSGKPTCNRSNELISLAYKNFGSRFIIIGCGGVFCAADAYEKIKRGASLVQLITGLIFEGPQLVSQINAELPVFLARDGYASITEAVGKQE